MKLAFLYAGQGAQHVGMGRDLYETYPAFRAVLDSAPVDFDLKQLCFDGPEDRLNDTRYTQPCMVAFAAGVTALLKEAGIVPDYTAGLSLGEYSALHCAGVLDAPSAISLVAFRGQAMADAVKDRPCGMAAVLNLDRDALKQVCEEASDAARGGVHQLQLPRSDRHFRRCRRGRPGREAGQGRGSRSGCCPSRSAAPSIPPSWLPPETPCGRSSRAYPSVRWRSPVLFQLPGRSEGEARHHPRSFGAAGPVQRLSGGHHPPPGRAGGGYRGGDRPGPDPVRLRPQDYQTNQMLSGGDGGGAGGRHRRP